MRVLGISAFYHDSAAALVLDGEIVAAAQEERFTRKKHDSRFPSHAIRYCLRAGRVPLDAVDHIVFYEKPFLKFERLLETYLAFAPRGFNSFRMSVPIWLRQKLFLKDLLRKELSTLTTIECDWDKKLLFSEHHLSHAASAFFPSPFQDAAILTMDGAGEWATTSSAVGHGNQINITQEIRFPHSLGLLYSAFTYYTGFKVNSGEYKVMGLAPYGEPKYAKLILDHLIDVKADGSYRLEMSYFDYCTGLTMTNKKFHDLFGGPPRKPGGPLTQREMDLAASIQSVTEEVMLRITRALAEETGLTDLCLAGGVALNCVANGKVLQDGKFKRIWIQPSAGDAGGALGAALAAYYLYREQPRLLQQAGLDQMKGTYLGPSFSQSEIEERLRTMGARFETLDDTSLINVCVQGLAQGKALGWFQGRMEFGPRALGSRSILADARSSQMQSILNLKVKYRESFRPFAPSILLEDLREWFDLEEDSPYMLLVAAVAQKRRLQVTDAQQACSGIEKLTVPRSEIPAVTHIDFSARVQTVHPETNPRYYALISAFKKVSGCPVLVNTSFNIRGEPIVCSPEDAFQCFMGTQIDLLAIGNCLLRKEVQTLSLEKNYSAQFELD